MPWNCLQCGEPLRDDFVVCWNCGTDKAGRADPFFPFPEIETHPLPMASQTPAALRSWWRLVVGAAAFVTGLVVLLVIPTWLSLIILIILGANCAGLSVAWFVTWVLGVPNDGSIRWEQQRRQK